LNIDRKKILIDLLKPFVLRRLKRDVLTDLPNKTELMIFHDLSKVQKELYKALLTKNRCKNWLKIFTQIIIVDFQRYLVQVKQQVKQV
jgi:SNF2 family DNA or RNA helicase